MSGFRMSVAEVMRVGDYPEYPNNPSSGGIDSHPVLFKNASIFPCFCAGADFSSEF
jgi:hypothetical protein